MEDPEEIYARHEGLRNVLHLLQEDLESSDLYWCLFTSSAFHYKVDSLLRPFPPMFMNTKGEKNVDQLRAACHGIPNLSEVFRTVFSHLTEVHLNLLCWVFNNRTFKLAKHNTREKILQLKELTKETEATHMPSHVFEVIHSKPSEDKFIALKSSRELIHAYHGSRVENYYSILKNGLQSNLNKTSLFGEGTYLTSELSVANEFAPVGPLQSSCLIGDTLSIVALCEVINDESVKCQRSRARSGRTSSRAPNSIGGEVPDKYYVVTNNEMVRVKYLLVHAERRSLAALQRSANPALPSCWSRHGFLLSMLLYATVLLCVGMLGSQKFWSHVRRFYAKATGGLDYTDWSSSDEL